MNKWNLCILPWWWFCSDSDYGVSSFKNKNAWPSSEYYPDVFCVLSRVHFVFQTRWWNRDSNYFPSSTVPNPTASIKAHLELHLPHCVPRWCQSSSELHFPFVNTGCVDLFKNITQVPGETWWLPSLQIKRIHLLICSDAICLLNLDWLLAVQTWYHRNLIEDKNLFVHFPPLIQHNTVAARELSWCDMMSDGLPLYVRN